MKRTEVIRKLINSTGLSVKAFAAKVGLPYSTLRSMLERGIGNAVGGIKTDAGKNRPVPIHPLIYPIFVKYYNKNGETIFCNEEGKKMSARTYREKKFAVALETLKMRALTPYSCRHTFATMLNRVNAPSANIQKLIGHVVGSDTTDKVYTHPEIEDLRKTIEMLS